MSDQSTFIASELNDGNSVASQIRAGLLSSFGKARLRRPHFMNSATLTAYTLAGDYDEGWADCTTAPCTYTLPANPQDGDHYVLGKVDGSGNSLTIARNGKTINSVAANQTITLQLVPKRLTWVAAANTWISV